MSAANDPAKAEEFFANLRDVCHALDHVAGVHAPREVTYVTSEIAHACALLWREILSGPGAFRDGHPVRRRIREAAAPPRERGPLANG